MRTSWPAIVLLTVLGTIRAIQEAAALWVERAVRSRQ